MANISFSKIFLIDLQDLEEAINYENLQEIYQVQKCFTEKDRMCDSKYKMDTTTKDDYQCTNL